MKSWRTSLVILFAVVALSLLLYSHAKSYNSGAPAADIHNKQHSFSLPVGARRLIPIPKTDRPVEVSVSLLGLRADKRDGGFESEGPQIVNFIATYESATGQWNGEAVNSTPEGIGLTQIFVRANLTTDELIFGSETQPIDESTPFLVGTITYVVNFSY